MLRYENAIFHLRGAKPVLAAVSLMSLVCGATLACAAPRYPSHLSTLERCGGGLLVAGLVMLGNVLPHFP